MKKISLFLHVITISQLMYSMENDPFIISGENTLQFTIANQTFTLMKHIIFAKLHTDNPLYRPFRNALVFYYENENFEHIGTVTSLDVEQNKYFNHINKNNWVYIPWFTTQKDQPIPAIILGTRDTKAAEKLIDDYFTYHLSDTEKYEEIEALINA